jgi:hypothetical protein
MQSVAPLASFQLKYCERCGGLWLRPDGVASVYCPGCEAFMTELPLRLPRPRRKIIQAAGTPAALAVLPTMDELALFLAGGGA